MDMRISFGTNGYDEEPIQGSDQPGHDTCSLTKPSPLANLKYGGLEPSLLTNALSTKILCAGGNMLVYVRSLNFKILLCLCS